MNACWSKRASGGTGMRGKRGKPVQPLFNRGSGQPWRWARGLVGAGLVSLGLSGCAQFWDNVTSNDFHFSSLWEKDPNPMLVLRDSKDGDKRARALRALKEPKQFGGDDKDQDAVVGILVAAAKEEKQPLCRLAAIESLGHFKDPRATQGLIDAYYKATAFQPETATVVQVAALTSLGETKNPAGVDLLAKVVRAPSPAFDVTDTEKQQEHDRRLAAAKALGNFTHYQATEALVYVLKNEKDVALRDRAHDSLVAATGKDLPDDPRLWDKELNDPLAAGKTVDQNKKFTLTGWFNKD